MLRPGAAAELREQGLKGGDTVTSKTSVYAKFIKTVTLCKTHCIALNLLLFFYPEGCILRDVF